MRGVSLLERYPELARQWHPTKNRGLTPAQVTSRSQRKVWWKCPKGPDHEWETQANSRTYDARCPFCSGRRASAARSLATEFPEFARQWHPTKNGRLKPENLPPYSNRAVWWKCKPGRGGHEWQTTPARRALQNPGCPVCSSLLAIHPEAARQWHPTLNGDLGPGRVSPGSTRSVWWKCPKGPDHEWQQPVVARLRAVHDCPFCARQRVSITNSLARQRPDLAAQWHTSKNGGLSAHDVSLAGKREYWWKCPVARDHVWQAAIPVRLRARSPGCPFCLLQRKARSKSLAVKGPALAREWHPTRNGSLTPEDVKFGGGRKFWWICERGPDHAWQASVATRKKSGCPFCQNVRLSVTNTLARTHPVLARQWHPTKNGSLTPEDVVARSNRLVHWKCARGPDHEWRASLLNRTKPNHPTGCPFCAGKRASRATSLAATAPARARLWHPTKNGSLRPEDVLPASNKLVHWKCPKGPDHEWEIRINKMTRCPFCSGRRVSMTNCLATRYPRLASEWHPTKNAPLGPRDVLPRDERRFFWKCQRGPDHEWQTPVFVRVTSRCPFCAGKRVSLTNSLAGAYPEVAKRWHRSLNGRLDPAAIFATSWTFVWWSCVLGHTYKARVRTQTAGKQGCPLCAGM